MKHLILLASLLLASCNTEAADGYDFKPPQARIEREIKVVLHPNLVSVAKAKPGQPLAADRELFGFAVINSKTCTIHAVDPAKSYHPEQLGHELTHCLYGDWHD